jgi:hypothetical protein
MNGAAPRQAARLQRNSARDINHIRRLADRIGSAVIKRAIAAGVAVLGFTAVTSAEPLPRPSTDYYTKGSMAGGMEITYRHSKGKLRMEMKSPDMPKPMVGYFDVNARKGVMVMSMPGMPPMAIETGLNDEGGFGIADGRGQRIGSANVAGEACDEWRIEAETAEEKETDAVACITRDGIVMRVVGNLDGKRQTMLQVSEISRTPQDMKQLTPPANLKPMQMPGGMMPPRK